MAGAKVPSKPSELRHWSRPAAASPSHDLDVIVSPKQIAVRPLAGTDSHRHIHAAYLPENHSPTITATLDALRQVGAISAVHNSQKTRPQ